MSAPVCIRPNRSPPRLVPYTHQPVSLPISCHIRLDIETGSLDLIGIELVDLINEVVMHPNRALVGKHPLAEKDPPCKNLASHSNSGGTQSCSSISIDPRIFLGFPVRARRLACCTFRPALEPEARILRQAPRCVCPQGKRLRWRNMRKAFPGPSL